MWWLPLLTELIRRLVPDPREQAEINQQLQRLAAEEEARKEEAWQAFIAATTPSSERVYVWANTLISLVRPALAVFAVISPIIWTDRWVKFLGVLSEAGVWGAIALVPAWAWILGRDGVRMILGLVSGLKGVPVQMPPGVPGPSRPQPRRPVEPPRGVEP